MFPEDVGSDGSVDPPSPNSDYPSIQFSAEEQIRLREPWKNSLIVKVVGRPFQSSVLHNRLHGIWRPKGNLKLLDLGHGFHILQCSVFDDYSKALFHGPWFVGDNYLYVQKWVPNFRPSKVEIKQIALWVCLYDLPIEYFDEVSLRSIAVQIGSPLRIDRVTTNIERGRYARICISVDFGKPLQKIDLG